MAPSRPDLSTAALPRSRSDLLRLCCALSAGDAARGRRLLQSRGDSVDWQALVQVAKDHRLEMLLHRAVELLEPAFVTREARSTLRQLYEANRARCVGLGAELARLMDRLDAERIPVLAYKGPVLAEQLYGDVALRTYSDLDVLILERDVDAAIRALGELGYEPGLRMDWEMSFTRPTGDSVDLHWSLADKIHQFPVSTEAMWSRRAVLELAGTPIPTLGLEDTLLAVCFNGLTEDWQRCDRIADVANLLRRSHEIDWPSLLDLCRRRGCERIVLLPLYLAKELFHAQLPDSVEQRLRTHQRAIFRAGYAIDTFLHFVIDSTDRRQGFDYWRHQFRMRETRSARIPYYQSLAYNLLKPKDDDAPWKRTLRQLLYRVLRLPLLGIKHGLKAMGHATLRGSEHRP